MYHILLNFTRIFKFLWHILITVKRHGGDFMQKLKLCISILLVMILSFSLLVPSLAEDSIYVWSTNSKEIDENIINVNSDNNLQDDNAPSNR